MMRTIRCRLKTICFSSEADYSCARMPGSQHSGKLASNCFWMPLPCQHRPKFQF